jgi:hypothetical protein
MSTLGIIILVVLVVLLVGAYPAWGYSRGWGYGPVGWVTILLILVIVLMLTGTIRV